MFCINCGIKLEPGNRFCIECGTPIEAPIVEGVEEVADPMQENIINFEIEENNLEENNIAQEEKDFLPTIVRRQDEFANKLKDKFSYQKKDLIEALKERKKDAKAIFQKAASKTKESIAKILEDEIDVMEEKLEKLKSMFEKGLLPEDEYKLMRDKAIHESIEYKSVTSKILEDQMNSVEARLAKLKSMFERELLFESEYNSIRRRILNI